MTELSEFNNSILAANIKRDNNLRAYFGFEVNEEPTLVKNIFAIGCGVKVKEEYIKFFQSVNGICGTIQSVYNGDFSQKFAQTMENCVSSEAASLYRNQQIYKVSFGENRTELNISHSCLELIHYPIGSKLKVVGEISKQHSIFGKIGEVKEIQMKTDKVYMNGYVPKYVFYKLDFKDLQSVWIIPDNWCELVEE